MRQFREEGFEEGFEDGFEDGKRIFKLLISRMSESGEADRIPELANDEQFLEEMLEKYNL